MANLWKRNRIFVFRAWQPSTTLDGEFRLFIREGKLLGISQYVFGYYSPRLVEYREVLRTHLLKYYESTLNPLLSSLYRTYALDILVTGFRFSD